MFFDEAGCLNRETVTEEIFKCTRINFGKSGDRRWMLSLKDPDKEQGKPEKPVPSISVTRPFGVTVRKRDHNGY